MVINPSTSDDVTALDGSKLDKVDDFKYLGSYTNMARDIECRKAQAWSALFALTKVWRSSISKTTKLKIFKTSVELILLYGCESWTLTKQISASIHGCCGLFRTFHGNNISLTLFCMVPFPLSPPPSDSVAFG
jgi:hypothetical protein